MLKTIKIHKDKMLIYIYIKEVTCLLHIVLGILLSKGLISYDGM